MNRGGGDRGLYNHASLTEGKDQTARGGESHAVGAEGTWEDLGDTLDFKGARGIKKGTFAGSSAGLGEAIRNKKPKVRGWRCRGGTEKVELVGCKERREKGLNLPPGEPRAKLRGKRKRARKEEPQPKKGSLGTGRI